MTIERFQDDSIELNKAINEGSQSAILNAVSRVTDDVYTLFPADADDAIDMEARAFDCDDVYKLMDFVRFELIDWLASF